MNFNDYQLQASQFAKYSGAILDNEDEFSFATYPFFALAEETGEVLSLLARCERGDTDGVSDEDILKELGDVLWNLSECARQFQLTLDEVATHNLDKLIDRKNRNKIKGKGDNR